jgi:hypothetical protein
MDGRSCLRRRSARAVVDGPPPRRGQRLALILLVGIAIGFGAGWTAFDWKPWSSTSPRENVFLGKSCFQRNRMLSAIQDQLSKEEAQRAQTEKENAEAKEPC